MMLYLHTPKARHMREKSSQSILVTALFAGLAFSAHAHEKNAPFSGAIIDPFELHHAHIENEQRVNLARSTLRNPESGEKTKALTTELELAWASPDYRYGFEIFIPYQRQTIPDETGRNTGVGDIEIRPLKYALINDPQLVVTTATGLTLPTGDKARGLGEGKTTLRQFLFVDKAVGNWFFGLNLGASVGLNAGATTEVEYGLVTAYSFISGTAANAIAPTRPDQHVVWTPSLELTGVRGLTREARERREASLVFGLNAWLPRSGWQWRVGVAVPASQSREADRTFLFQIGNHFNWDALL